MIVEVSKSTNYLGRDIVVVTLTNGIKQPFYRSTGVNSGMPSTWLPFDGIFAGNHFIKARFFLEDPATGVPNYSDPLYRFGSHTYKRVSELLATMSIPSGTQYKLGADVNTFIKGYTGVDPLFFYASFRKNQCPSCQMTFSDGNFRGRCLACQ